MTNQFLQTLASRAFQRARVKGLRYRWITRIRRKGAELLSFDEVTKGLSILSRHAAGIKTVHIDQIRGTLGKANEFDNEFNPVQERIRERWTRLAEKKMEGCDLPPVELLQVGETYFVSDGHHRISVSRAMGQNYIDAQVTVLSINARTRIQ